MGRYPLEDDLTEVFSIDLDEDFQDDALTDPPLWCWPSIIIGVWLYITALATLFAIAAIQGLT